MKKAVFLIAVVLVSAGLKGQMFPLSDAYVFNPLMINPAYCGTPGALSTSLSYRNQWAGLESAPKSQVVTLQAPMHHDRIGLGLEVDLQSIGIFRETGIFGNYAYRMELGHGKLALGLAFGATLNQSNWNELVAADPDDAALPTQPVHFMLPNFSVGAWYQTESYFLGLSMPRFVGHTEDPSSGKPVVTVDPKEFTIVLTGGATTTIGNSITLCPSMLLKAMPGHDLQADFFMLAGFLRQVQAGLGYRTENTLIGILSVHINPQFELMYSYDFVLNRSDNLKSGSHEFALRYT
jgi:type IX secretion system PorP/SprF family membrane protein